MISISAGALFDGVNRGGCAKAWGDGSTSGWTNSMGWLFSGWEGLCDDCDLSCSVASACGRGACTSEGSPFCRVNCVSVDQIVLGRVAIYFLLQ